LLGESFQDMRREGAEWVINDRVRVPLVIGAGGHFCPVARQLGARPGNREAAVFAKEVEFQMQPEQAAQCQVRAEVPELFFCEDLKGYAWVFRKGDWLNIGLGRQDKADLGRHLDDFLDGLTRSGRLPAIPRKLHGHAYLLYGHTPRRLVDDGVLLVGDAAGLAYVQSGEGIRPAIESALLAASVIARCQGSYQSEQLQPYVQLLEQRFGRRDLINSPEGKPAPGPVKRLLAGQLLASRWFARHVVLNRWFFHLHQPPLRV
jgi:menaquinone-9 beta-reductase